MVPTPQTGFATLARHPRVAAALAHIDAADTETIGDMVALTQIPAPSGSEQLRGTWFADKLRALNIDVAHPDEVGNIRGLRPGSSTAAPIMLVSHLDTVFSADTDLRVRRDGDRICAAGISDNSRGVAALVRIASALHAADLRTQRALAFVGSVGEEGAGDLRGVKHLFSGDVNCAAFVAVDGAGVHRVVHRAVGSRRLRVTIHGPGGHSWIDRGTAHPAHALAAAIALAAPSARFPESSFSVGRIESGTGINVIPVEAHADIDIRSEDSREIARIEVGLRESIDRALHDANTVRRERSAPLTCTVTSIGDRPGGRTAPESDLVRMACDATRYCGFTPELGSSSTDANVPMSRGIPSIAIGAGGDAGGMHTTEEWYDNTDGVAGLKRLLLLAVSLAGVSEMDY